VVKLYPVLFVALRYFVASCVVGNKIYVSVMVEDIVWFSVLLTAIHSTRAEVLLIHVIFHDVRYVRRCC